MVSRSAIVLHGFLGDTSMMEEVASKLTELGIYKVIHNLSYYDSRNGLDISKTFDVRTPIFQHNTTETLTHNLFHKLSNLLKTTEVDFFAHSMGGLVTRAMLRYLAIRSNASLKIGESIVKNVFLIGTPNHGTLLAKKFFNFPGDLMATSLNLLLDLPRGMVTEDDLQLFRSQFVQMIPKGDFLHELNAKDNFVEKAVKWFTFRGLNAEGLLGLVWQPVIFRKYWLNRPFPFVKTLPIPNDGVVNSDSVPLPYASNYAIEEATHMDLVRWSSKEPGRDVWTIVKDLIQAQVS